MTVPLSEVKKICTATELLLVKASREPKLERLTLAEAKKSAQRARKLFDKWQDQSRGQARTRSRRVGYGEKVDRTQIKVRIFREALKNLDARVAQLEKEDAAVAGKPSAGAPKKVRSKKHRATRATARTQLSKKKASLNAKADVTKKRHGTPKSAAKGASTTAKAKAAKSAPDSKASAPIRTKAPTSVAVKKKKTQRPKKPTAVKTNPPSRPTAATAAKESRIARSGLTTRVRGHVSARGKRAQGRRDASRS